MTVTGPWAVITGASSGIGRAFAIELTGRGFPAFLIARTRVIHGDGKWRGGAL